MSTPKTTDKENRLTGNCPECGRILSVRTGKYGAFLGCEGYPDCHYMRPLRSQQDSHIVKVLEGQYCPLCKEILVLRQGRYGMFICCHEYPTCLHIETVNKPDVAIAACPKCQKGYLLQRQSRFGKTFYACNCYPECHFVVNLLPITGECQHCGYPLLIEKKTARGIKRYCADKRCAKPVLTD